MKLGMLAAVAVLAISLISGCEQSDSKPKFCYLANTGVKVCDGDYNAHGHPTGEAEKRTERQAAEHK